jgi:glycosyltransferase involved in cell wall biosynthesis
LIEANLKKDNVSVVSSDHAGVSKLMNDMDAGIFFIRPYYSKIASAPTKLGEFLGCGVPCLSNTGVGDMTRILEDNKVGVAIKDFEEISLKKGLEELIAISKSEGIRYHCRSVSLDLFSLDAGVRSYEQVYASLEGK